MKSCCKTGDEPSPGKIKKWVAVWSGGFVILMVIGAALIQLFNIQTKRKMKKIMIMLSLALVSWGANAQHDHAGHGAQASTQKMEPMFKDKALGTAYGHYIHLKNALVASDQQEAKKGGDGLTKALAGVPKADKALAEAKKVAQATTLEEQRKAFTSLSNEMATLVKDAEITKGELYLEYCPMANGNKGGSWLSNEKEIRNPYFGDKMLKCGSVKETIN